MAGKQLRNPNHDHPLYGLWYGMIYRCENPKAVRYDRYGGRGITVCERWKTFQFFCDDMGPRPSKGHSVDRIDNDGNYEPSNCRWATRHEQAANTSTTIQVKVFGVTTSLNAAARWCGVASGAVFHAFAKKNDVTIQDAVDVLLVEYTKGLKLEQEAEMLSGHPLQPQFSAALSLRRIADTLDWIKADMVAERQADTEALSQAFMGRQQ